MKVGRFGPYMQCGRPDDEEKPKNASLLKGITPEQVDLELALKCSRSPASFGANPQNAQPVVAYNGRFGPYVKCGEETRSLPADISPLDVTLEQALSFWRSPRHSGRGFAPGASRSRPSSQRIRIPPRFSCSTAAMVCTSPTARRTRPCRRTFHPTS